MIEIKRYTPDMAASWDSFVKESTTPTLIHRRGYMDYHSDRYRDHSLLAWSNGNLRAILPAAEIEDSLISHPGLTFGGWLTPSRHVDTTLMLEIMKAACEYMRAHGFRKFVYSPVPWIYAMYPNDSDQYALFRLGAVMTKCVVSSALPISRPVMLSDAMRRKLAFARQNGITCREAKGDMAIFYEMLSEVLDQRHGVKPVHTLDELRKLQSRFPMEIRLAMAFAPDGRPEAGALVYMSPHVGHTQYLATTERGRHAEALTALLCDLPGILGLIPNYYLDFGHSCEQGGMVLNEGLTQQKYGLGGRPVLCPTYELAL